MLIEMITRQRTPCINWEHSQLNSVSSIHTVATLWRPLLPYGYSYKASCARPG